MRQSDYTKKATNINTLMPEYLKNAFNTSFFDALHNKMLTKEESEVLMGYIGDRGVGDAGDPYIGQIDVDRDVNALVPAMFFEDGDAQHVYTFDDLLNRMRVLGVSVDRFAEWGKAQSFNMHFPINLDKFVNYPKYRWYGHLLRIADAPIDDSNLSEDFDTSSGVYTQVNPSTTWDIVHNFGYNPICQIYIRAEDGSYSQAYPSSMEYSVDSTRLKITFTAPYAGIVRMFDESGSYLVPIYPPAYNKDMQPEYVMMEKSRTSVERNPFNEFNFWVHEDDVASLGFDINQTIQAVNPIIEFESGVELNSHYMNGQPCGPDAPGAIRYQQLKVELNQAPLFNLYNHDGSFSGKVSSIFGYATAPHSAIDDDLNIRVDSDGFGDYTMVQGLVDHASGKLFFYKQNGELKSCWEAGAVESPVYVAKNADGEMYSIDPLTDIDGIGAWVLPNQMFYNVEHENRAEISYADLFNHFADVIGSQPGLVGSQFGKNNYRNMGAKNFGLGGIIKDYNTSFGLFMGVSNQPEISVLGVIDFAQSQYDELLTSVDEFFAQNIGDVLTDGNLRPSYNYSYIDADTKTLYEKFIETDLKKRNQSFAFGDTTSGVSSFPATLPYLGLSSLSEPRIQYVNETGDFALMHHDGHLALLTKKNVALLNALANKRFLRSDGTTTAGEVGPVVPARPYRNQFWYNTVTSELMMFSVLADSDAGRSNPRNGDFWYDRAANKLRMWTGNSWDDQPTAEMAWVVVRPEVIIDHIKLLLETDLYKNCHRSSDRMFDFASVYTSAPEAFDDEMQNQFNEYATRNGLDPFETDFSASNAFTWNYSASVADELGVSHARWYELYQAYFGTTRPDQEPWVLQGYTAKPEWWDGQYPVADNKWPVQMWLDIMNDSTPSRPAPSGRWLRKLGVDTTTGDLLPPYVSPAFDSSRQAIFTEVPARINASYKFGDNGPIEFSWRRSADFKYGLVKTAFRISPIMFVDSLWGCVRATTSNGYEFDRGLGRKSGHREIVLHGEPNVRQYTAALSGVVVNSNAPAQTWTVRCVEHNTHGSIFTVSGSVTGALAPFVPTSGPTGNQYRSPYIYFDVELGDSQASIGDVFTVAPDASVVFTRSTIEKHNGLSQWFVNFLRYNSIDITRTINGKVLREWSPRLVYRATGLISTENLELKSDNYSLHRRDFSVVLKKNERYKNYWLNAIRVQLVQKGSVKTAEGGVHVPQLNGADWKYRVEILNPINPNLHVFTYDSADAGATFRVLNGDTTNTIWKRPTKKTGLAKIAMPFEVVGIQNVVDFLFGYADMLAADGWKFSYEGGNIDEQSGRAIDWQLEIERFIEAQYLGIETGDGSVVSPFMNKVWFTTPFGMVSSFKTNNHGDVRIIPQAHDALGGIISPENELRVYRNDDMTQIDSDVPMMGVNLFLDSYEHILVFNNYAANESRKALVFDSFLGVRVKRMHITTKRQRKYTGRPTFGGHYLHNGAVKRNIESNVDSIRGMYDSAMMVEGSASSKAARSTVGYTPKKYMDVLGMTDSAQFGFWKGMIHNKGSNMSVDAFLNSSRFVSAKLDEYWAYKLAEYGDARPNIYPEIRLSTNENRQKYLKLQFLEGEANPQAGFVGITAFDDSRWFNLADVGTDLYFNAEEIARISMPVTASHALHDIALSGHPVISDMCEVFEEVENDDPVKILDVASLARVTAFPHNATAGDLVFLVDANAQGLPSGAYRAVTADSWDPVRSFELVNSTTIRFFVLPATGRYTVVCFGPSQPKFNPAKLIDHKTRTIVSDIALFDPARGSHVSEGRAIVDVIGNRDPAQYNYSVRTVGNQNFSPLLPWAESQIGRVWWDSTNLKYLPYSDVRRYPDIDTRLSLWGSLADYGSVDLHEWTESTVHPRDYAKLVAEQQGDAEIRPEDKASGSVSFNELYTRSRVWKSRPVAWKFTDAPGIRAHAFAAEEATSVIITTPRLGPAKAILQSKSWSGVDYSVGQRLGAFAGGVVVGEAVIVGNQSFIVGSELSLYAPYMVLSPITVQGIEASIAPFATLSVEIIDSDAIAAGSVVLMQESVDGVPYVRAVNMVTRDTEAVEVVDSASVAATMYELKFPRMGFAVKGVTNFGHTDFGYGLVESRKFAIAAAIGNPGHQITIRSAVDVDVKIPFIAQPDGLVVAIASIGVEARSFCIWDVPQSLVGDLPAPFNVWEPVYGAFAVSENTQTLFDSIKASIASQLVYDSGEKIVQYAYDFGPWAKVDSEYREAKYDGTGTQFFDRMALSTAVTLPEVTVYVNGAVRRTAEIELSPSNPRVVRVKGVLNLGDEVRVVKKRYEPTKAELEFDPQTKENPSLLAQYKYDYQYTIREFRDEFGEIEKSLYYFWVKDKGVVKPGRSMSLLAASQVLTTNPNPYGILQNLKARNGSRDVRYTQFVTVGLNRYVTEENTYKLRFTKNFTLRDDPEDLNLKNTHAEWVLIRENQRTKIPEQLWNKLVDSATGEDVAGNPLPSLERIEYDKRFNTRVRYGFGFDQVLVDRTLALRSILYAILVASTTTVDPVTKIETSNELSFLDYESSDEWFDTPEATRKTLTDIWNRGKPEQINYIFFTVFHDALAENYEFSDIFKTSMIAAHSIRLFNNIAF